MPNLVSIGIDCSGSCWPLDGVIGGDWVAVGCCCCCCWPLVAVDVAVVEATAAVAALLGDWLPLRLPSPPPGISVSHFSLIELLDETCFSTSLTDAEAIMVSSCLS